MPRSTILRFEWNTETATAPDGTRYAIFSEHVRGEVRYYWPEVYCSAERDQITGLKRPRWLSASDTVYTSSAAAKARAERHWHDTQKATDA